MPLSNELIQICNNLPQDIAILSFDNQVVFTNSNWLKSADKFAEKHIFATKNAVWPNPLLNDKQLLNSLRIAVAKAQTEQRSTSNITTDISLLGYQYHVTFFIGPLVLAGTNATIISIQITMNSLSGDTNLALLGRDEAVLLNSLLEGVVIQDANGVITANNSASEEILGLTSHQMRGLDNADPNWGTITEDGQPCPPEDHPSSLAIKHGVPVLDFTMGVNKADGGVSWLKINSQPIFKPNESRPHMSVTSFVDITEERQRQKKLIQISKRLQLALDAAEIGIWEYDISAERLVWDEAMFSIIDVNPADFKGKLSDFSDRLYPADKFRVLTEFSKALNESNSYISEFRIVNSENKIRHIYVASTVIQGAKGEGNTCIGINRDITDEKQAKQQIEASRNKLLNFIEDLPTGVCSIVDGKITLNVQAEKITGYKNSQLSDVNDFWQKLFVETREDKPDFYASLTQPTHVVSSTTMKIVRGDGLHRWIEFKGCQFDGGQAWVMIDVTDQKEAEAELKKLAYFDPLTHLPNRTAVEHNLIGAIARAKRHAAKLGVLVIDVDSFKNVNDTYGHPVGDQLLVQVAQRLRERLRDSDFIGRMGGDEFMVIIEDVTDQEHLTFLTTELLNCFSYPLELIGPVNLFLNTKISIGASIFPEHGEDEVTLFKNADTALYKAKSLGKNRVQIYLEEFTLALKSKLTLEQRIESAIDNNDFSLYFQPIVNCQTNQIESVESLIRWFNSELGTIPPDQFIPAAEVSGQIIKLGRWVITVACEAFVSWQKRGINLDYIAVNLSPLQFNDEGFIDDIRHILNETGINPNKLVLEITEGCWFIIIR
ncbi:bifunctional diguanylate cyclase/phosphodiesterase [Shewanella aestuarii]|uniref:Diguanylate cyclase n=1 Tax=Shewanella aestuarii TaxID=1028752 RepID=A0A6G9QHJ9_9GAMM|nr:diguanylate cyclase [Shewanella aestuarii]QIR13545.1 diguanylate cyclase [Shewanella aestuarii]